MLASFDRAALDETPLPSLSAALRQFDPLLDRAQKQQMYCRITPQFDQSLLQTHGNLQLTGSAARSELVENFVNSSVVVGNIPDLVYNTPGLHPQNPLKIQADAQALPPVAGFADRRRHVSPHSDSTPGESASSSIEAISQLQDMSTASKSPAAPTKTATGLAKIVWRQPHVPQAPGPRCRGSGPHQCDICRRRFSRPSLLEQHRVIHSGIKPFACAICGNGFTSKGNWKSHQRVHTGEKPHPCLVPGCGQRFSQGSHLYRHMRGVHGVFPITKSTARNYHTDM